MIQTFGFLKRTSAYWGYSCHRKVHTSFGFYVFYSRVRSPHGTDGQRDGQAIPVQRPIKTTA